MGQNPSFRSWAKSSLGLVAKEPARPLVEHGARSAERSMEAAEDYASWKEAALRRDRALGLDSWRREDRTRRYDWQAIRDRIDTLRALRARNDAPSLMNSLNEGIHGNISGIGRATLWGKSTFGTKDLIVEYVELVSDTLRYLAEQPASVLPSHVKIEFFERARICFGSSALMLSGSGTLFYFHLGVVRALVKASLLPKVISGASGGALVAGVLGTRPPSEFLDVLEPEHFRHFIVGPGESRSESLRKYALRRRDEIVQDLIPNDLTLREARALSGLSINISVAPADIHQTSRLLNEITAPTVFVRESVLASSALPGAFPSVTLASRDADGQRRPFLPKLSWVDGSLSDDLPAKRLARLCGVNHFIVSQVNPHVVPLVTDAKADHDVVSVLRRTTQRTLRELINGTIGLIQRPAASRNSQLAYGFNAMLSILNQDYLGNVNIMPPLSVANPLRLLSYRSDAEVRQLIAWGERATWPKLEMIRVQTLIGRTLDDIWETHKADWRREAASA